MEDRRGALWIGTMQYLYRRSADGPVEQIVPSARADLLTIHALLEDRDGRVWVGTRYGGVFQLTVDTASHRATVTRVYAAPRDLRTNWITTIVQSADGAVWVGSNLGVFHFLPDSGGDGYRIRAYSSRRRESDEVWAIAEDRQHNLWLGRRPGGVGKLWHRGLTRFDAADGLSWANSINATRNGDLIAVGGLDGNTWCLCRFDGRKFIAGRFPVPDVSTGWGWSQTVLQDRTGDWWIATDQWPVPVHEPRDHRRCRRTSPSAIYTTRDGLAAPQVFRLFEDSERRRVDRDGRRRPSRAVALAAEDPHLPHYTDADGLPRLDQSYVASFAEDRAGHVWIGFGGLGGLARHQDGRFVRFTTADGGPAGRISNLLLDSKGRLWAATDQSGISGSTPRRGAAHVRGLHHGAGPVQQFARSVVEDLSGRIYVATGRGIDRIDPVSGQIRHYLSADGVPTGALARCATVTARCGLPRPAASYAWCLRSMRRSARRLFSLPRSRSAGVRNRSPRLASRRCG